jgi:hypothetical protein
MDGSSVIFIVMPIVIALVLFTSIALPYIANSRSVESTETSMRRSRHDKERGRYAPARGL